MAYERVNWQDYPSKATPLNAENLNKMDEGIASLDAESESLKAFGNEGKLVYVHDGALDTLEPSNLDLHVGSPTVVTEAAQMTDSSKIYVYNGEETGYTAGDWYSYDGEQWVDRGPFNEPEIVTDKELTVSDRPADGKVVGDKLATKAEIDGAYDAMTVGSAEQLISTVFVQDNEPYTFRTAGGYADIGDRMQDTIIGGSVVWNQLVDKSKLRSSSSGSHTVTPHEDGSITLVVSGSSSTPVEVSLTPNGSSFYFRVPNGHKFAVLDSNTQPNGVTYKNQYNGVGIGFNTISNQTSSAGYILLGVRLTNATEGTYTLRPQIFDLTQMFGTEIADFIYNVEQANPGAGVSIFRKMFPKSYYEYNAGEIKSITGLAAHETTGFNQWDEEWEVGGINSSTGAPLEATDRIRSKNFCSIMPSTTYYGFDGSSLSGVAVYIWFYDAEKSFISGAGIGNTTVTTPSNARYFKLSTYGGGYTTYNHDICINLSWDGERDGEYEEYVKNSYPLDSSITLRGMLHRDVDGNFHYHGDKYESDGTVTRKYGVVDLGTLTWVYDTSVAEFSAFIAGMAKNAYTSTNLLCSKYPTTPLPGSQFTYGIRYNGGTSSVVIKDTAFADASVFKAAMDGVMLVYELATPTIEQAAPFAANQVVDDFGTEAYTFADGAFEMPVGHESKYTNNLRAKLEMAPNSPSGDGKYLLTHYNGQNTYIPYVAPRGIPMINPSEDGEYELILTMSNGTPTLEWTRIYNPNQS